jgi:hypothetical protein
VLDRPPGRDDIFSPLTPTAFLEVMPPKWGFFFALNYENGEWTGECAEYKGLSLDVYFVIEAAWRDGKSVTMKFDGEYIVGAQVV